jgi:DNA-binding NarL/FixJ family response regulator
MRILIVDDSSIVRHSIAAILTAEPGLEICGEAANGREALERSSELAPELVLLDMNMPGITGLETARRIRVQNQGTRVLLMTQDDPAIFLSVAIAAGAEGCVDKMKLHTNLIPAIQALEETRSHTKGSAGAA